MRGYAHHKGKQEVRGFGYCSLKCNHSQALTWVYLCYCRRTWQTRWLALRKQWFGKVVEARILKSCLLSGEVPLLSSHCWLLAMSFDKGTGAHFRTSAIFQTVSFWPVCLIRLHFLIPSGPAIKLEHRLMDDTGHSPLNSASNLWNIHTPNSTQNYNDATRCSKSARVPYPCPLAHVTRATVSFSFPVS